MRVITLPERPYRRLATGAGTFVVYRNNAEKKKLEILGKVEIKANETTKSLKVSGLWSSEEYFISRIDVMDHVNRFFDSSIVHQSLLRISSNPVAGFAPRRMRPLHPDANGLSSPPGTANARPTRFAACSAVISAPLRFAALITSVQRESIAMMRFRLGSVQRGRDAQCRVSSQGWTG